MQDFKVGDKVKFQLHSNRENPRYNYSADEDPSGEGPWAFGAVSSIISTDVFVVSWNSDWGLRLSWEWTQPSYMPEYYDSPGYLAHVKEQAQQEVARPKNNDGRTTCAWCEAPTKSVQSLLSVYTICTKCGR